MYAITTHVEAPPEAYHAVHREVMGLVDASGVGEGLVVHLAYATAQGFDVVDVWESRALAETFNAEVMPVAMQRAGVPTDGPAPEVDELDLLNLMIRDAADTATV